MFSVCCKAFLFFLKPDIWLNAGWCTNTVQMLPCCRVRTENSEIVRNGCNAVSAVEVLYSFCMASSVPRVARVFRSTPKTSLFQLGKRKLGETGCVLPFLDEMSPSLLCLAKSHSRTAGQVWLGRSVAPGRVLVEEQGHGRRDDSRSMRCHTRTVTSPGTGPGHLIRLDASRSVGLTTAERERSSSPETPLTLYPEGLVVLEYLVMLWYLLSNHCCEWLSDVVWQ